jgi:hypothetical protein
MDWIPKVFLQAAEWALSILPDSPFLVIDSITVESQIYEYIQYINWFVPVPAILALLSAWTAAILVYYIVQIVLRWANAIE